MGKLRHSRRSRRRSRRAPAAAANAASAGSTAARRTCSRPGFGPAHGRCAGALEALFDPSRPRHRDRCAGTSGAVNQPIHPLRESDAKTRGAPWCEWSVLGTASSSAASHRGWRRVRGSRRDAALAQASLAKQGERLGANLHRGWRTGEPGARWRRQRASAPLRLRRRRAASPAEARRVSGRKASAAARLAVQEGSRRSHGA